MPTYKIYNGHLASLLYNEKELMSEKKKLIRVKKRLETICAKSMNTLQVIREIYDEAVSVNQNIIIPNIDWINSHDDAKLLKDNFTELLSLLNEDTINGLLDYYTNKHEEAAADYTLLEFEIKEHQYNIYMIAGETDNVELYENEVRSLNRLAQQMRNTIDQLKEILANVNIDTNITDEITEIIFDPAELYIIEKGVVNVVEVKAFAESGERKNVTSLLFTNGKNAGGKITCRSIGNNMFEIRVNSSVTSLEYITSLYVKGCSQLTKLEVHVAINQNEGDDVGNGNNYYVGLTNSSKTRWNMSDMTDFSYVGISSFTAPSTPSGNFDIMVIPTVDWGTPTSMKVGGETRNPWQTPVPWITSLPSGYTAYYSNFSGNTEITDIIWTK